MSENQEKPTEPQEVNLELKDIIQNEKNKERRANRDKVMKQRKFQRIKMIK